MSVRPASRDLAVRDLRTYSESAMVMAASADGRLAATLRFCRFPDADQTWLWCHLLVEGEMYAFTSHDLACDRERLAGAAQARYVAPPMDASLERDGQAAELSAVRIEASLPMHRSSTAPHGPGPVAARLSGVFTPGHTLAAGVLQGRDEVYGELSGEIEVDGRRLGFEGPAKFHEQHQEGPRFQAPFCYSWLAGRDVAATTLLFARGASGGWAMADGEAALKDMIIDPPGERRRVEYLTESAGRMPGELDALVRYQIPIYDRAWRGSFVKGVVDGRSVVGVVNDWLAEPDIYLAARARIGKNRA